MDTATATAPTQYVDANKVQHVTKKSSDELLRKFAELGPDDNARKKRKKKKEGEDGRRGPCGSPTRHGGTTLMERRPLLPLAVTRRMLLFRQVGMGRVWLRTSDIRKKIILLGTIEKTWRKTVEGASQVFIERHYHRHKRLINDIV